MSLVVTKGNVAILVPTRFYESRWAIAIREYTVASGRAWRNLNPLYEALYAVAVVCDRSCLGEEAALLRSLAEAWEQVREESAE